MEQQILGELDKNELVESIQFIGYIAIAGLILLAIFAIYEYGFAVFKKNGY